MRAGVYDEQFAVGRDARHYQLTIPARYDGHTAFPLILALHALTVDYKFVASMTGFTDMAPRYDFIGVAPAGRIAGATPYWLAAPAPDNYDLTYMNALLDHLEATMCIDQTRVFSTGMSNGAQMSSLLACRMADRVTAVAPVSGVEFYDSCNAKPVGVIAFHGTADPIVTYNGGGLNSERIADEEYWHGHDPPGLPQHHGVDAAMQTWALHNHCDAQPVEDRVAPHVRRRTWQHCAAPVVLYIVEGGGHAWPGKPVPSFEAQFGKGTKEVDASSLIFAFFLGAPRAPR
jgi:polyhydroxybutyrate depolymerase